MDVSERLDLYVGLHQASVNAIDGFISHIGNCRPGSLTSLPSSCENEIMMEPVEIDVLKAFLHPEVVMFEFGSGVAIFPFFPFFTSHITSHVGSSGQCPTSNPIHWFYLYILWVSKQVSKVSNPDSASWWFQIISCDH